MVLYLNQYALMANKASNISYTYWVFPVLLCGNPSLLQAGSDPHAILLLPVHGAEAMCMLKTANPGVGLGLFILCVQEKALPSL